ncbi:MAG: hypothetical protein JRH16_15350 [Deltaproteobacteria bacterium]|nr:hypothetical protein [Deltaproteobacteria bacterium]MBW2362069.1 hypothetical protein [Deltaproteobacteria bacterium]
MLYFFENVGILALFASYPHVPPGLVAYSSAFTISKQMMNPGATVAFLVLPVLALARSRRKRKGNRVA